MGCCQTLSVLVVTALALFATGILSRAWIQGMLHLGYQEFAGNSPMAMSPEELRRAPYAAVPAGALDGQVCIVTGANVGLGFYTAKHLAMRGCETVVAGRRLAACEAACASIQADLPRGSKGSCHAMPLDLGKLASVRAFTDAFVAKFDRLDALVLNAGISFYDSLRLSADGVEEMFAVNHLGHFAMTRDLIPLIERTAERGPVRVVVVSSAAHFMTYPDVDRRLLDVEGLKDISGADAVKEYGQSKLANVLFAQELSRRFADKQVFVNSLNPGLVSTNITMIGKQRMLSAFDDFPFLKPAGMAAVAIFNAFESALTFSAEEGARTQFFLAAAANVSRDRITGKYFHPHMQEIHPSQFARGQQGAKLGAGLWAVSERLLEEAGYGK